MQRSAIRSLVLGLAIAGVLMWAAWQRQTTFTLAIGGTIERGRTGDREIVVDDAPYLFDVHDPEPAELTADTTQTFRWSEPHSEILVPHINPSSMIAELRLAAPRENTPITLEVNTHVISTTLAPGLRTMHVFAPHDANNSLHLILRTAPYVVPNDQRVLGVTLFGLDVTPTRWQPSMPWTAWLQLLGVLACLGVGAALVALPSRVVGSLVVVFGALLALLLATTRTLITTDSARLLAAAASGLGLVVAARWLLWLNRDRVYDDALIIAGLTGLGLTIRLAGIRHPQTNFSDLTLNINNLNDVRIGTLFFTEGLPCEAGAGRAPYPPGLYIILLPFLAVFSEATKRGIVVQYGGALLDALIIPLIWWAIRAIQPHNRKRAAVWAAALYLIPLPVLRSMVVGEWSNVAGQAVGTAAMLGVIAWVAADMPRNWRPAIIASLVTTSLMHSGVLLGVGLWGVAWVVWLMWQRRWFTVGQLVIVGASALVIAVVLYFSVFVGDPSLQGNDPLCPVDRSFFDRLLGVGRNLLKLDGQLPAWLWFVGLVGAIIARERFIAPLWAWLAVLPLSLGSLISTDQTIRWWIFITPALCIGGGIGLHRLAQRSRRERWLAVAITVFVLTASLVLWLRFITEYRTGKFVP